MVIEVTELAAPLQLLGGFGYSGSKPIESQDTEVYLAENQEKLKLVH